MHPLISIISFIVCAISLSLSVTLPASFITFILCLIVLFSIEGGYPKWRKLIFRLRWFWVSIIILYIGFTPGPPVWPTAYWSPSYEGFRMALMRLLILLDIFTLVFILHSKVTRSNILAGLHSLCWPLQFKQGLRDKLVMRLILTFEYVEKLPELYKQVSEKCEPNITAVNRVVYILQQMIHNMPVNKVDSSATFQRLSNPVWYEWSYPVLIAVVYQLINII